MAVATNDPAVQFLQSIGVPQGIIDDFMGAAVVRGEALGELVRFLLVQGHVNAEIAFERQQEDRSLKGLMN